MRIVQDLNIFSVELNQDIPHDTIRIEDLNRRLAMMTTFSKTMELPQLTVAAWLGYTFSNFPIFILSHFTNFEYMP